MFTHRFYPLFFVLLSGAAWCAYPAALSAQTPETEIDVQAQGTGAAQFEDVLPTDWAFPALDDLVRRYHCLKGYPDGTFRGDQPVSRDEFAAGLDACLQQLENILLDSTADAATPEELGTLNRQMQDLFEELGALDGRVDASDGESSAPEGTENRE